jgi:hypothetical protein
MMKYKLRHLKPPKFAAEKFRRSLYGLETKLFYHPGGEVLGDLGYYKPFRA